MPYPDMCLAITEPTIVPHSETLTSTAIIGASGCYRPGGCDTGNFLSRGNSSSTRLRGRATSCSKDCTSKVRSGSFGNSPKSSSVPSRDVHARHIIPGLERGTCMEEILQYLSILASFVAAALGIRAANVIIRDSPWST